ncbi:MAG: shikimate kinase [Cytophagaceae bacterium]|nr:shikimate kinase [Cytophagaceae bacterium]
MKPIFLLGMPSSGKSTLGRNLARLLGYEFVDLDKRIETREGLTISELFALRGEDYFRQAESAVLKSLPVQAALVVSTGGGVPCFFDNIAYIKTHGLSVFLDLPPSLLAQRMLHTRKDDRPLYRKTDPEELLTTLEATYEKRLPYYQQADIIVTGETTAEHLLETLRYFGVG